MGMIQLTHLLFTFLLMKFIIVSSKCASAFVCRGCTLLVPNKQRLSSISSHCDVAPVYSSPSNGNSAAADSDEPTNGISMEIERLQQQLNFIEAIEERNKAQIDSFVDEQDQWDSMEEYERQLLQSKVEVEKRLEQLTSELVSLWISGKSIEG
jgi:hypothetical protein